MSFPRYPNYKDSGVEWLGEVPEHWEVWKLSHAFTQIGSGTTPKTDKREYYDGGDIPWVNTGDLNDGELDECEKRITALAIADHSSLKTYPAGSLMIAMYGATIGKLAMLNFAATVNQACCVFAGKSEIASKFMFYWFLGLRQQIISLATGGGQPNISQDILRSLRVASPPLPEQTQIAAFLDRETAKIDELVAEQRRLMELLKEKRQAVISHTVTKGLSSLSRHDNLPRYAPLPRHSREGGNPEATAADVTTALDSRLRGNDGAVPMKPSGIEWLGDVPAHWDVISIKWLSPVKRGASPRPIDDPKYFDDEGEFAWVRIADVSSCDGVLKETTQQLSGLGSSLSVKISPGELFVSIAGTVGKPCITTINACIHDGFVYFPSLKIDPQFLYRIFEAGTCYGGLGKWGTQLNLNTDTIGSIRIALPPIEERKQILEYLDLESTKLDTLTAEAQRAIDLLQERRTALISAAVTGQIDVRSH